MAVGTASEGRTNVNAILMSAAIFVTIILAMAIGIVSGYGIIVGILAAFDRGRSREVPPAGLVASTGTTGD